MQRVIKLMCSDEPFLDLRIRELCLHPEVVCVLWYMVLFCCILAAGTLNLFGMVYRLVPTVLFNLVVTSLRAMPFSMATKL